MLKLKEYRTKKNMTVLELAESIGYSPKTVYGWEEGLAEPNIETLIKLSNLLKVSIDKLVGKEEEDLTKYTCDICGKELATLNTNISFHVTPHSSIPFDICKSCEKRWEEIRIKVEQEFVAGSVLANQYSIF